MSKTFNKTIERLKYDLVRDNLLSYDDLTRAEKLAKSRSIGLSQAIIQLNIISEDKLLSSIEAKLHIPYVNLNDYTLDNSCLMYISEKDARNYKLIPLFRIEDVLTVAMADPLDLFMLNNLMNSIECKIEPVICSESSILKAIDNNYSPKEEIKSEEKAQVDWRKELNKDNPDNLQAQNIIVALLQQAKTEDAQEIFIEPHLDGLIIKFKKGLNITAKGTMPILLTPSVILNIKALANLNINISNRPQLGRLKLSLEEEKIFASVSTFPTIGGERICIKIFKPCSKIEDLQINPELIFNESGLILVAGSSLQDINQVVYSLLSSVSEDYNVMAIESCVKYKLDNVNQAELNEKVGFNPDKVARFLEFQSPDIVYLEDILTKYNTELVSSLARSGKIVITDLLTSDLSKNILESSNLKGYKEYISFIISVENINKIRVLREFSDD